uniref:Tetratricopeptide repeat domain 12 n=1 Tax=Astatotilapia calliptera TaxID=8154 RepID=A0A3P8QEL9_ASTCA
MKIMEMDAEERRVRKAANVKKAIAFKDKGNEAYAQEDYETAVKYYSDGLAEIKDMQPLYTNRAQAYIKLGKYNEAVSDCEWALKCNERCIKAYLHMGKAYLGLKKYNEARGCFEKIEEIQPGKEKIVKEYLTQVDLGKEKETQEIKAREEFDKGKRKATTVVELLEKLSKPGQIALYYCGGLEILSQALTDCECSNNCVSPLITVFSFFLVDCVSGAPICCVSVSLFFFVFPLLSDENQKLLMTCPVATQSIVHLASSEHDEVAKECLALLSVYSEIPRAGQTATKYAIKTLTVCTAASHLAREKLVNSDKKLSIIRRLLSSSCDEMVSGNAALCLAHCLDLEGVASDLLGTDIVLLLLQHAAGDAKRTAVQQNAAIALGKLCRCEPRYPLTLIDKAT